MAKKFAQEKFISRLEAKYGKIYKLFNSQYIDCFTPITLLCQSHNSYFTDIPFKILSKSNHRCADCHGEQIKSNNDGRIAKLLTKFKKQGTAIHNGFYCYTKSIYIDKYTQVEILCPIHGSFWQLPGDHIYKKAGCQECAKLKVQAAAYKRMLSETEILERANKIHNNRYQYPDLKDKKTSDMIPIICPNPEHGLFTQSLNSHLCGIGCPKCGWERTATALRSDTETFVTRAIDIHGPIYDYSLADYNGNRVKIKIICPKHGMFSQTPFGHLQGSGCPECGDEKSVAARRSDTKTFISSAIAIHGSLYDYSLVEYVDAHTKVNILCPTHKKFPQTPNSHLSGYHCPKCNINISRQEIEWLDYMSIPDDKEHRQVRISLNDRYILVDGFDPDTNTVYEFHGDFWHGNPECFDPNKTNYRNKKTFGELYKNTLAREEQLKQAGYSLITIWETDWQKIKKQIKQASKENEQPAPSPGV